MVIFIAILYVIIQLFVMQVSGFWRIC